MKKLLLGSLVIVLLVSFATVAIGLVEEPKKSNWDSRYGTGGNPDFLKMRQATVEIKVGKAGGAGAIVYVDEEYLYVLTAQHNIKGGIMMQIKDKDGNKHIIKKIPGKNIIKHKRLDLALIKVSKPEGEYGYFRLATPPLLIGEDIYTIGHPAKTHYTINRGIVSTYTKRTFNNCREEYTLISAPSWGGNSGGAVVNSNTELVGISVGILYVGTDWKDYKHTVYLFHMTYAVTLKDIVEFMYENGLLVSIYE